MTAGMMIIGMVIFVFIAIPTVLVIKNSSKDKNGKNKDDLSDADNLNRYTKDAHKKRYSDESDISIKEAWINISIFAYPLSVRGLDDISGKIMETYRDYGDIQDYGAGGTQLFNKKFDADLDKVTNDELLKLTMGAYEVHRINDNASLYFYTNSRTPPLKSEITKDILSTINNSLDNQNNVLMCVKRGTSDGF